MQMPKKYRGKLLEDEEITDVINETLGKKCRFPVPGGGLLLLVCEEKRIAEVIDYDEKSFTLSTYENELRRALGQYHRYVLRTRIKALFYGITVTKKESVMHKPLFDKKTLKHVEDLVSYACSETHDMRILKEKYLETKEQYESAVMRKAGARTINSIGDQINSILKEAKKANKEALNAWEKVNRWEPLIWWESPSLDQQVSRIKSNYLSALGVLGPAMQEPRIKPKRERYQAFGGYLHETFMHNLGNGRGTKSRFAERIGVHPAILSQYFSGKMLPGKEVLRRMAPALKEPYKKLLQKTEKARRLTQ